jgi:hypothetical protein
VSRQQLPSGALQATDECLKDFDSDAEIFTAHIFHVTVIMFYDGGRSAGFDGGDAWFAEDVANLARMVLGYIRTLSMVTSLQTSTHLSKRHKSPRSQSLV